MKEIKKENFDFYQFFQTNYGLGSKPGVPELKAKDIVWGVLVIIAGIVVTVVWNAIGLIASAIGAILIVGPILILMRAKGYQQKWMQELNRRASEWPQEFDKTAAQIIKDQKFEERGMSYLGIDPENLIKDEKSGASSFDIRGNNYDGGWRRINGFYRTEFQEITWLYFGTDQLYIYKVKLSLIDPKSKKEESLEFFYKDIVSVSVAQESVDVKGEGSDDDGKTKQVDSEKFRLVVPGDKLSFAYIPNDYTTGRINAMKSMIRDKKTH